MSKSSAWTMSFQQRFSHTSWLPDRVTQSQGGDELGCEEVSRIEVSYQTDIIAVVHGCPSLRHCPHVVWGIQLQNLLGDDLMTACSHEEKKRYVRYGWAESNLRWYASPIDWHSPALRHIQKVHSNPETESIRGGISGKRENVPLKKRIRVRYSITYQPLWSTHRGRACRPPLLDWRRWFGGRVKLWGGSVRPSTCPSLGYRSLQSSDSGGIVHGPRHRNLYHLMNTNAP